MSTVSELLVKAIRHAADHNPDLQAAPTCILWPDGDRQWEEAVPRLLAQIPELLILGDYAAEKRTAPAIWLRCAIAGKVEGLSLAHDNQPILYLPGVSRQDLRAVESCPDHLKPLAELQYRGVIWSQSNSRDWTILAFLRSDQGGLGLDVAQDRPTLNAMLRAINRLLDEDLDSLKGKHLDSGYFDRLLSDDPVRDLLLWLDQGDVFRTSRGEVEWQAFRELCKSHLAFDPESEGALSGATKLANHGGAWQPVWDRFCEAPKRYPNIPVLISQCAMPAVGLLSDTATHGGWPKWNDHQETTLRIELSGLSKVPPHEARRRISDLEAKHKARRNLVWAELGEAPLTGALEWLAVMAEKTANGLAAGTLDDLASAYSHVGWCADDAVLRALALVEKQPDVDAVRAAVRAVYLPWAEDSARYLQEIVGKNGYPGGTVDTRKKMTVEDGECVLFVDGLRFDVARRLVDTLSKLNCQVEETLTWAALPTVTATGKPAATPVRDQIRGAEANADFEPGLAATGQSLKGGYHLRKLLTDAGWEILEKSDSGTGSGRAWCEFGDIDHEGHDRGARLAKRLDAILGEIQARVQQLVDAGWKRIRIVTDHGWLLMPGGLPKTDLPAALAENKRGRCAAIKPGAVCDESLFPWYWNPTQYFALANGVSCYRNGEEYAHGGLSLQECLVLDLVISPAGGGRSTTMAQIVDVVWKGLRCKVAVEGEYAGLIVDVRQQPADPDSSIAASKKPLNDDGTGSVVIKPEYEDLEGHKAWVVLLDGDDQLVAQVDTVIGGGDV